MSVNPLSSPPHPPQTGLSCSLLVFSSTLPCPSAPGRAGEEDESWPLGPGSFIFFPVSILPGKEGRVIYASFGE